MATRVTVPELPKCDFCAEAGIDEEAHYDGATIFGPWANMCTSHFGAFGKGLGTGIGQRLILKEDK